MHRIGFLICLGSLGYSAPALACTLKSAAWSGDPMAYDPFDAPPVKTYQLAIDTTGDCAPLEVQALMPMGDAAPSGAPRILIHHPSDDRQIYYHNQGSAGEPFLVRTLQEPPSLAQLSYDVAVLSEFLPPSYSERKIPIRFKISGAGQTIGEVQGEVAVEVLEKLAANFAGASASGLSHELNLGVLSAISGAAGDIRINLTTNAEYSISFKSENGGKLSIQDRQETSQWYIPYTLQLNGDIILSLLPNQEGDLYEFSSLNSLESVSHEISIEINGSDIRNMRAGLYNDYIDIIISTKF